MSQENVPSLCYGSLAGVLPPPPPQHLRDVHYISKVASSPAREVADLTHFSPGHAHNIKHLTR